MHGAPDGLPGCPAAPDGRWAVIGKGNARLFVRRGSKR